MDDPLDFEKEDRLLATPRPNVKRKKVIGLDDLLTDYYKEQSKSVQSKSKKYTVSKGFNSDEDDDKVRKNEIMLTEFVDNCEKKVNEIVTDDEISLWGQKIFGYQKNPPSLDLNGLASCEFLQSLTKNELMSVLDLSPQQGESFLEGLLKNGWLSKVALMYGFLEDSIATWTFYKLLYSSNEDLQVSACDFWCSVLLSKDEADQPLVRLAWYPSYSELKGALEIYGYLYDISDHCSSVSKEACTGSGCEGPPRNIRSWLKVVSACCRIRSLRCIFSTSEAEDFLVVIICLSLDRQLQGLSFILDECMQSVIAFFIETEWDASCRRVADSVACRIPKDLNCLRVVECISGISSRGKHLRSQLAFQMLRVCCDKKVGNEKGILKILLSMNVKEKKCDFLKLYVYLVLAENWIAFYKSIEERDVILDMWNQLLRNCSSQITSTDWRSYASKVRNKASYVLQNSMHK